MRRLLAALAATALFACGGASGDQVVGRVVEVDGDLLDVASFVVLDEGGGRWEFVPASGLLFDHDAPLSHLQDHVRDGAPVRVVFEERPDGTLVATEVTDD